MEKALGALLNTEAERKHSQTTMHGNPGALHAELSHRFSFLDLLKVLLPGACKSCSSWKPMLRLPRVLLTSRTVRLATVPREGTWLWQSLQRQHPSMSRGQYMVTSPNRHDRILRDVLNTSC